MISADERHDGAIPGETCLTTVRTARIKHVCCNCYGNIQPGQKYQRVSFPPQEYREGWTTLTAHLAYEECDFP